MLAAQNLPPFVMVDPMTYFPDQKAAVEGNLAAYGLALEQMEIRVARNSGENFDFILIVGTHRFHDVVQDLRWAGLLNVHGILALHDYMLRLRAAALCS